MDEIAKSGIDKATNVLVNLSVGAISNWYARSDFNHKKATEYAHQVAETHKNIQILGMPQPKHLSNVYVSLRAHSNYRKYLSSPIDKTYTFDNTDLDEYLQNDDFIESLLSDSGFKHLINETSARHTIQTRDTTSPPASYSASGLNAFLYVESNPHTLVLGQPGSGKTTFFKALILAYCGLLDSRKPRVQLIPRIPIYINLKDCSEQLDVTPTSDQFLIEIQSQVSELTGRNYSKWLHEMISEGSCIILTDGLDEVPKSKLKSRAKALRRFYKKYNTNKYVTSCRTSVYDNELTDVRICEIDDFSHDDISLFIKNWFVDRQDLAERLIKDIKSHKNATDLLKTPLLCTLVCIMYSHNRTLPNNRSELYGTCVDTLMFKWDSQRDITRDGSVECITPKNKRFVLSEIARLTIENRASHIEKSALLNYLKDQLQRSGAPHVSPEALLRDYENNMGLVVEYSSNTYQFSHLTLQEFFAAISYVENHDVVNLAEKAFHDPRLKEVFLLSLEMMHRADEPLIKLMMVIKNHRIGPKLSGDSSTEELISQVLELDMTCDTRVKKAAIAIAGDLLALNGDDLAHDWRQDGKSSHFDVAEDTHFNAYIS
ncbi:NACHT domain-containing NTPase [Agaribacterium sp. ZY112]|uniref:NACHT domain-containing protein n=1 Tax=Agaribacterium sp. ZY112 TaxID=3233574 RepID=UPI003523E34B